MATSTHTADALREKVRRATQLKEEREAAPKKQEPLPDVFTHKAKKEKASRSYEDIIGEKHPSGRDYYFNNVFTERKYWPETLHSMIPEVNPNHKFDHDYALIILMAIEFNKTAFAFGPPGTGKTTTPEQICARINRPFAFIGGMGGTEPSDYVGSPWVTEKNGAPVMEWKDAMASFCVRNGVYLLYDEPFKASAQTNMCFQSLLDDRKTLKLYGHPDPIEGNLVAHKDFRICLADNVRGFGDSMDKYAAEIQDQSTLNRCAYKVHVDYVPNEVEIQILKAKYPDATDVLIKPVVSLADLIRTAWKKGEVDAPYSIRDTQEFVESALFHRDIAQAFKDTYYGAIEDAKQQQALREMFNSAFGRLASL